MTNQQPISTFLGIAAVAVLVSSSHAAIISVPGDQGTIQAGIDAAVNGDEVVVAQGIYFENINFNGKAITVRSTDPNDAGVVLNTIINGGGSGSVVTCNNGEGSSTVLSGFVITGGNAFAGGGMSNRTSSSPTVTNCTFSGNTAFGISGGGGMFNDVGSSPTVTNCSFSGNTATTGDGGGMSNTANSPTVTDCSFNGNTATAGDGGGMSNFSSNPMVTNCSFSGNTAILGGGMANFSGSSPTVTNSVFCENTPQNISGSYDDGGGNCLAKTCDECGCPTDVNGDGTTNVLDLIDVLLCFGLPDTPPCDTGQDINADRTVNVLDLIDLLLEFGTACP